jgi:hypothetical protein
VRLLVVVPAIRIDLPSTSAANRSYPHWPVLFLAKLPGQRLSDSCHSDASSSIFCPMANSNYSGPSLSVWNILWPQWMSEIVDRYI